MDVCVLLTERGDKVKEQKTRLQQASVEAALETPNQLLSQFWCSWFCG